MSGIFFIIFLIFSLLVLNFSLPALVWEIGSLFYLMTVTFLVPMSLLPLIIIWFLIVSIILLIHLNPLRQAISNYLVKKNSSHMPKLSKTEQEALNAGDTWLEKDIFTGNVNWERMKNVKTDLTDEEQSFLNNETSTLCAMVNDWEAGNTGDLSPKVWQYLKDQGFFGLVIDKKYGGHGFSARAHADVVMKIASRSIITAVTVMVPNSLGPGELLQFYGTDEQKNYYLPRLAKGIDIPCFALTEPTAGSDATSIQSEGVVEKRKIAGKEVLGINLTLNKRWITLSPVATLIGLAIKLKDPDNLLAGKGHEGITCLLISRDSENLEIGNRHIPSQQMFMNGTIRGENVFVPIDSIIGGQEQAGNGWQMLVECLSIGRSISLPALGASSAAVSYVGAGAFSRIRKQFKTELAHFEGIEEKLAEIAGISFLTMATRLFTVAAVNEHKKPSVASAITKYWNTEFARIAVNHAMDIHGGRTVVTGPRNYLNSCYQGLPICITVEGANIMTRNLLIFGQGSMACHPFVKDEFYAIVNDDKKGFNKLFWNHIYYSLSNFAKMTCSAWTSGIFISAPKELKKSYQSLVRLSYTYAWMADVALGKLGGNLKRKERLSARLADALSYLYMAMACLQYYELNQNDDFKLHALWATKYCFYHAEKSLIELCANFPSRIIGFFMRFVAFPFGATMDYPDDKLDHQLAQLMSTKNAYRDTLLQNIYLSGDINEPLDKMEQTFRAILESSGVYKKVGNISKYTLVDLKAKLAEKVENGIITQEEMEQILKVEKMRWDAIQVDEFNFNDIQNKKFNSVIDKIKTPFD